jgi:hypothetical protein
MQRRRSMMSRAALALAVSLLLAVLGTAVTFPARVHAQPTREATLILRILSYDRNLRARTGGGQVRVLVAFRRGNAQSESAANAMVQAINQLAQRTTVAGMRPRAVSHPFTTGDALQAAARSERAIAVWVCAGLEDDAVVSQIASASRASRLLAMTGREASVRAGLGIGLIPRGSQIRLLVNLRAVQEQGARMDAALLRLADVIR